MKPTPHIDLWREQLRAALTERGRKAELARHLASIYGREQRAWQQTIQNILTRQIPNGELVLAINAWMQK